MAKDDTRVRLPELPIFKKYSLALRQEFATPKELLGVLDRTASKVQGLIEKAEAAKRALEPPTPPEIEAIDEEVLSQEVEAPTSSPPIAEGEPDLADIAGEEEEGVLGFLDKDEMNPEETDLSFRPIWESEPPAAAPRSRKKTRKASPARGRSAASGARSRTKPRKKAPARKSKQARLEIVRVSRRGTPIKARSSSSSKARKKV